MPRLRPSDVVAFLGPSLSPEAARAVGPCRVLPPARAGDVLAILPERPLAIALVDGLFDTTPSVWHREILAALDAGIAVFGGASMGALRAAELARHGVVGVGRIAAWYRDGVLVDDGEVALLHAGAEHGFRPFTVPLVQVRAAAEAARSARVASAREARALLDAGAAIHYGRRTWPAVLDGARLGDAARERLRAFLPGVPDLKAEDARATVAAAAAFARARRAGAPPPPRPDVPPPPSHLRRTRLARARTILPDGCAVASGDVVAALGRRPDAGRLAADGLRRALVAALARSFGLRASPAETARAERAWLDRLGVPRRRRDAFLATLGLDDGAARALAEDLALEASALALAERLVPDGPGWAEGLALAARLSGAWLEAAVEVAGATPPVRPSPFDSASPRPRRRSAQGDRGKASRGGPSQASSHPTRSRTRTPAQSRSQSQSRSPTPKRRSPR